jgi:hypothetical protein
MPCDFRTYGGQAYQEFFILRNTRPAGPEIAKFAGVPVHAKVEDEWGRFYQYAGTSSRSGSKYTVTLGEREFILPPGIVYRMLEPTDGKGVSQLRTSFAGIVSGGPFFTRKPTSASG